MKAYRAVISADRSDNADPRALYDRILLGGVLQHISSPFELREDAESFAATIVQGNREAGRRVAPVVIKEVNVRPRYVILHASLV